MAIFREYSGGRQDRSAEDRRRHKQLVEEAIKKNVGSIIAEESIIGQSKDKKIRIPIRGIKEFQFIYGENQPGVGSGTGSEQRGQRIGRDADTGKDGAPGAGNQEGEDIYETEITLEELAEYLFEDLELPYLERKRFTEVISERSTRRWGIQRKGIPPRLSKKKSMMERIKRKQSTLRTIRDEQLEPPEDRFPFKEEDLRYHRVKPDIRRESNAVVICIMDTSGSMYQNKKYLARSFFFLLYHFVRYKYANVEVVFVAHTTTGKEVNEDEFFHKGESGGTLISSGYQKALEIIEERYNQELWNIYAFHCSDGDNWMEDKERAVEKAIQLCEVCNLFGYGEISSSWTGSTMLDDYKAKIKRPNFVMVRMVNREDIWPAFKQLMAAEQRIQGEGDETRV